MKLSRRTFFPSLFRTPIVVKQVLEEPKVKEKLVSKYIPNSIGGSGSGAYTIAYSYSMPNFYPKNWKEM